MIIYQVKGYTLEAVLIPNLAANNNNIDKLGRFTEGHVPANKGKSISEDMYSLLEATMFKKGREPHNTKSDGSISIRKDKSGRYYKYIRLAKSKWELLHRHNWEKANGEIPKGKIITFIDNDAMNCERCNLECISRKESIARNRNKEKSSKSMKMAWAIARYRKAYGLNPINKLRVK